MLAREERRRVMGTREKSKEESLGLQLCVAAVGFFQVKSGGRRVQPPHFTSSPLTHSVAKDRSHSLGLSPLLINSDDLGAVARAKRLSQQKDYQNR